MVKKTTRPKRTVSHQQRFQQRQREQYRAANRWWLLALLVAVAGFGLFIALLRAPYFQVAYLPVVTSDGAPAPAWLAKSVRKEVGGVSQLPLVQVNLGTVQQRIEEAIPAVAHVQVDRHWPSTLELTVTPRPALARSQADPKVVWAAGGVVLPAKAGGKNLPVISQDVSEEQLPRVLDVLAQVPQGLLSEIGEVKLVEGGQLAWLTEAGQLVIWGDSQDAKLKQQVLEELRAARPKAAEIDVSTPTVPVVREK